MNKRKIINDPIYGLININNDLLFDIIEHPYFQRLRRIKQLGLTDFVYPGATHTRFEHVLGATHLMKLAIDELRNKGNKISNDEAEGVQIAILMHDLGHGPFSHTLEHSFVQNISHEEISVLFMNSINSDLNGKLSLGIEIFNNTYSKRFLHKLVSSQLDMDRLDYLRRDSFFTGVAEGNIGSDRIIKLLNLLDDDLVVEEKGIYSIENFLIARRLMYWQVYLHKTVVSAEKMLVKIIERAKEQAADNGVFATPALGYFINNKINNLEEFTSENLKPSPLETFAKLDDSDILVSIKEWINHEDSVLANISKRLINRKLFQLEISNQPFDNKKIEALNEKTIKLLKIKPEDLKYFVFSDVIKNKAYDPSFDHRINILLKNGNVADIAQASDISNISALSKTVEKYFLCYPKECN